ncbi:MAG: O-antigen ligase family protein, partial [Lacisediminihabitans sp.]
LLVLVGRSPGRPILVFQVLASLEVFAALVLPLWTGSRSVSTLAIIAVVGTLIALRPLRQITGIMVVLAVAAAGLNAAVWAINPSTAAYGLYRLVPPPISVIDQQPTSEEREQSAEDLEQAPAVLQQERTSAVLQQERIASDANRAELWQMSIASIREDPVIGGGQVYFEIDSFRGLAPFSAHNFVLEHNNAYGGIGFLLYLALFVGALWPGWRLFRRGDPGSALNLVALAVTAVTFAVSLIQPTLMITSIVMTYFVAIGALKFPLTLRANEREGVDR